MSRLARVLVPGLPHHETQRGNRRKAIFFEDEAPQIYCDILAKQIRQFSVEVWGGRGYEHTLSARMTAWYPRVLLLARWQTFRTEDG